MQPQDQNQYNFIMNSGQQSPGAGGPAFLQDPTKRLFVAVGFVIGVLVLVMIGLSIILSLGKQNQSTIIDVAAYQTELVRISEIGLEEAEGLDARAQISTMYSFMNSDLSATTTYLAESGAELSDKQAVIYRDPTLDEAIMSAAERNAQDEEILSILEDLSASYKRSLGRALDASPSVKQKALLDKAAANILTFEDAQ